ncbi:hypothetical protein DFH06DRAFT_611921 [Mycena polygramma]|nr:hypothetical protein DFH06DRAFT_611921 [Mycena polygramma]
MPSCHLHFNRPRSTIATGRCPKHTRPRHRARWRPPRTASRPRTASPDRCQCPGLTPVRIRPGLLQLILTPTLTRRVCPRQHPPRPSFCTVICPPRRRIGRTQSTLPLENDSQDGCVAITEHAVYLYCISVLYTDLVGDPYSLWSRTTESSGTKLTSIDIYLIALHTKLRLAL